MDFTRLDKFLDYLTSWRIPGNDCIVYKDGVMVYRHLSGYAEIETGRKIDGTESYKMWSCSKPITCAAALTLLERGDILLTDPVSNYLPEFADVKVKHKKEDGTVELLPANNKITVRDLFTMSTGYSYGLPDGFVESVKEKTGGRCPTRAFIRALATVPVDFEPGTRWMYGLSHDILACLIEVVSGEKFSEYVKRVIFDPLEMADSTFGKPNADLEGRLARQYQFDYEKDAAIPTDNSVCFVYGTEYESGGAGLISTTEDYGKFALAMANGGVGMNGVRILSSRSVELMRMNAIDDESVMEVDRIMRLRGYGYGLGVRTMINPSSGGALSPVGEFGWSGAAGAYLLVDPDNRIAIAYTQHMLESQETYIIPRLRNIVYSIVG